MPRCKNTNPETVDELLQGMETAETIVEAEIKNVSSEKPKKEPEIDDMEKREMNV